MLRVKTFSVFTQVGQQKLTEINICLFHIPSKMLQITCNTLTDLKIYFNGSFPLEVRVKLAVLNLSDLLLRYA